MPARLVYSPKVYAYTKDSNGAVYNLTNYIVSGNVQRKVDQVSSASITLRNPYKLFTGGLGQARAFHPMDPITIYLERLSGFPVRVFTGYLDETPYYQMYPGSITLTASCTLKRLLYSYFDPSLPYVISFFTKYGWINTGQGSIISSQAFDSNQAATQADVNAGKQPFDNLQDGSLAKLLWAILYDIGQWQDSNIYIENLPSGSNGIAQRMADLMKSLQDSQSQAANDFTAFLDQVVGGGTYGSSGNPNGGITNPNGLTIKGQQITNSQLSILNTALSEGAKLNAPKNALIACIYAAMGESNVSIAPGGGVWQDLSSPNPNDVANEANAWYTGRYGFQSGGGIACANRGDPPWMIANEVEANQVWNTSHSDSYGHLWNGGQAEGIAEATAIVNAYSKGNLTVQVGSSDLNQALNTVTQSGKTAPGTNNPYVSPFLKASNVRANRYDQGIDYTCAQGSDIVAIGDSVFDGLDPNWYLGQPLLTFQLLSGPLAGCRYYYAEGITPPSYPIGTKFSAGQTVATTTAQPTGLEFGWASNTPHSTQTYAQSQGATSDTDSVSLNASHMFGRFMATLNVPQSSGGDPGTGPLAPNGTAGDALGNSTNNPATTPGNVADPKSAQAFVAELQFPSVEEQITAIALGAEHKGLMHDQSLMPFVQQVAQASMRSFQSLPNGDFYAFYPDYFGEMGHHKPYWYIRDIEILDGGINLNDDALATHVFAVGDNTWPVNNELLNMMFSAGTINIFNAFVGTGIITKPSKESKGLAPGIMNADEAIKFIQRYGARPLVQDYPMVRSPIYEMLLAYQQFMFAWSNQFKTPFTFTFMPELFPGGKVGFPEHGLQMYINSVTHSWNYEEGGFTTEAELSAPSVLDGINPNDFPDLPPYMVEAIIEPVKQNNITSISPQAAQQGANALSQAVNLLGGLEAALGSVTF